MSRHLMRIFLGCAGLLVACASGGQGGDAKSPEPCRDQVEKGGRQAGAAVKTGATTAVAGVKTFGKSVGGLVSGGSSEAREEWKKGSADTKKKAHEGADDVKHESRSQPCD